MKPKNTAELICILIIVFMFLVFFYYVPARLIPGENIPISGDDFKDAFLFSAALLTPIIAIILYSNWREQHALTHVETEYLLFLSKGFHVFNQLESMFYEINNMDYKAFAAFYNSKKTSIIKQSCDLSLLIIELDELRDNITRRKKIEKTVQQDFLDYLRWILDCVSKLPDKSESFESSVLDAEGYLENARLMYPKIRKFKVHYLI